MTKKQNKKNTYTKIAKSFLGIFIDETIDWGKTIFEWAINCFYAWLGKP
jgi:hypothetical protein